MAWEIIVQQQQPDFTGLFLLWAIWGAVADHRYKKRGGVKPIRMDKILFSVAVILGFAALFLLGTLGASAEGLSYLQVRFAILLFCFWELGRWRVRRRNPLPPASKSG